MDVRSDIALDGSPPPGRGPGPGLPKLESDLEKVLDFLGRSGIPREEIEVSAVTTMIQYRKTSQGYDTNEIEQYVLDQTVTVRSKEVDLVASLSRESTTLIREGVEFFSFSPEYYYSGIEDIRSSCWVRRRRTPARAEQLAVNSGGKVGPWGRARGIPDHSSFTDVEDWEVRHVDDRKAVKAVVTISTP